jgi:hypothetical protein
MRSSVRWLNDILIKNIYMGIEWREELILICYERMIKENNEWGYRMRIKIETMTDELWICNLITNIDMNLRI